MSEDRQFYALMAIVMVVIVLMLIARVWIIW
jgi:hypothetical protein